MKLPDAAKLPVINGVGPSVIVLPHTFESGETAYKWKTVLDFLTERFTNLTRGDIVSRIENGMVRDVNGEAISVTAGYQPQQKLYYYRAIENELPVPFHETILFEDELIVVADKPHFLAVTPGGRFLQETLLIRLKRKLANNLLAPMHRIDRETAGLVLFCKVPALRGKYQLLFQQRQVQKTYLAVATSVTKLRLPITYRSRIETSENFMQMQEVAGEANAEVCIECLHADAAAGAATHALYQLRPVTGKKHQLRVQMAALGLPILGDQIYPTHVGAANEDTSQPLQLLAQKIAFTDPVTGAVREFMSARTLKHAPV